MVQMRLKAQGRFLHNGHRLLLGEEFDCDEADALDLIALGRAVRAPTQETEAKVRRTYKRRDLEVEGE